MSVASMEPPQPSVSEVRSTWSRMFSASWSTPMCVRCIISTTSRSMPRGAIFSSCQISCRRWRRPLEVHQLAGLLAELGQRRLGDVAGDVVHRPAVGLDAHVAGHRVQLGLVADAEALGLAVGHRQQGEGHAPAVVGVRGGAGGDSAGEVAGGDGGPGGAAHAARDGADQAAGPHGAVPAAGALGADGAGHDAGGPVEGGLDHSFTRAEHLARCSVDALLLQAFCPSPFKCDASGGPPGLVASEISSHLAVFALGGGGSVEDDVPSRAVLVSLGELVGGVRLRRVNSPPKRAPPGWPRGRWPLSSNLTATLRRAALAVTSFTPFAASRTSRTRST